jgi:hypothetical protein
MLNVKAKGKLVITGAAGTISKLFTKYLSNIPGRHDSQELQNCWTLHTYFR